jgi:RimJ/RimL family protein N-acetyltransferase
MLPGRWSTDRLLMRDVAMEDAARLLVVFNANAHIGMWDTTFQPIEQLEMDGLVAASLAQTNSRGDPFQMQAICRREGAEAGEVAGAIIGYYHIAYGVRRPEILAIGMFVLDPQVQNQRYGSEVLAGLSRQLRELPTYQAAWARVWLKNWPALRMWVKAGFDRIVEISGDKVLSAEGQANVILEQDLRRSL